MGATIKERTLEFIKYKKISIKEFEIRCGLSNGYVSSMRKGFGADKLNNVLSEFPELHREWLLYGEGEMLNSPPPPIEMTVSPNCTPVYDVDATMGSDSRPMEFLQEHIIGYVNMPNINKNAAIIRANGDSMTPVINDGNFIAVREITDFDDIFYGQIYLVVTAQNRMVKYVRKNKDDEKNYVILRSENKEYDDILMPKAKILKMFIVENILSLAVR